MATTEDSRFRITVWPGEPVAEPQVGRYSPVELRGDWLVYGTDTLLGELPFDAYLHEVADADRRSWTDLRSLSEKMGAFVHPFDEVGLDLPVSQDGHLGLIRRYAAHQGWTFPDDYEAQRDALYWEVGRPAVHVAEVSLRVWLLQRMGAQVVAHASGLSVREIWPEAANEFHAWTTFATWMNAATRAFHTRVYVSLQGTEMNALTDGLWVSAYQVGALQILNHLNVGMAYNRCANSTCGRAFVRQRGRGEHYTRTEGVRYCSRSCANAQTQRDYRNKKKQARGSK